MISKWFHYRGLLDLTISYRVVCLEFYVEKACDLLYETNNSGVPDGNQYEVSHVVVETAVC